MGIVNNSILTIGQASVVVGLGIIILSLFIAIVPGIGSIFNMILIGTFIDLINRTGILKTPASM